MKKPAQFWVKINSTAYRTNFPKRSDTFLRYFSSHFIADFLIGSGPKVIVDIDGSLTVYPSAISDLVVGKETRITTPEHEEFGVLEIVGFNCRADASKGLDGFHQLHLLADKRTVLTREIEKLLGIKRVEVDAETDLVFHGCVSGEYLNQHVNEGRTAFVLEEKKLDELARFCSESVKSKILFKQIEAYTESRRQEYRNFVEAYPIYGFADEDTQLSRVPFGASVPRLT